MNAPASLESWRILPEFDAPGPVAASWINDHTTELCFIRGPAGSGKTTAAVYKGPYMLGPWIPICRDGCFRARLTVIRDNYRRLQETALKSWKMVFAEDFPYSKFEGGQDRPVHHTIELMLMRSGWPAGAPADDKRAWALKKLFPRQPRKFYLEVDFFGVGDHSIEEMLRGYETTAGWLNECDLLDERVPTFVFSRTARYPSKLMLPDEILELIAEDKYRVPRQVYGDLNPPDMEHFVERWDREKKPGFKLYKQPSGLSPRAENRKGKSKAEYEAELKTLDPYDAQRFVYGQPGYARDGIPVYLSRADRPSFDMEAHVAKEHLRPAKGIPLVGGFDAGGEPAGIWGQEMPGGELRLYAEVVTEPITGAARFAEMNVMLLHSEGFAGLPVGLLWGDPSAFYGADKVNGEYAFMETVALGLGHNIVPAPSNEIGIRIDAVQKRLERRGGILIDPRCTRLIAGFAAHYKLGKDQKGAILNGGRPIKNAWSHVHDALQCLCLGLRGRSGVIQDSAQGMRPGNIIPINRGRPLSPTGTSRHDFDVFTV